MHIDRDYNETVEKYFLQKNSATSGVMILGKTRKGAAAANKLFMKRQVSKYYILQLEKQINYNHLENTQFYFNNTKYDSVKINSDKSILVSSLIIEDENDEKQFKMKNDFQKGRLSQTLFYPINNENNDLFIVKLLTGRRHQIRLHTLLLGTNIKNDITYGNYITQEDPILYLHSIFSIVQCINDGQPLIASCNWINQDLQKEIIQKIINIDKNQ